MSKYGSANAEQKVARVPVKFAPTERNERLKKPAWIRARFPGTPEVARLKKTLRQRGLNTVCEEAGCPNLGECFGNGTAAFMILGDICTRRCPFCDVAHGRPQPVDTEEVTRLAETVRQMGLSYVVVTSVDRDDLRDGGARHFADCVGALRAACPKLEIEILTPDFRARTEVALNLLGTQLPDIFNHNLETVPRLYKRVRPGADYQHSLSLLKAFAERFRGVPTKSGLMLGLGEDIEEAESVMRDLRQHGVSLLTLGQYLQPTRHHLPVERYLSPAEFESLAETGYQMGFVHVASAAMVRSSYHADQQAKAANGHA
ncbi:MAG: lipoyl synthase [Acidiferrobacteraceae bacterium]|nr:lipoyl synthase [Acidiferrobacteraceae bacterium]MDP6398806.1 lipoyl synthase [Arenicellales bacterium]MDP6551196.1 lipoyl synthase [Arenicellales bacterium]MDP6918996.1 lipoyl synthase [Arenicellales bacterium]